MTGVPKSELDVVGAEGVEDFAPKRLLVCPDVPGVAPKREGVLVLGAVVVELC